MIANVKASRLRISLAWSCWFRHESWKRDPHCHIHSGSLAATACLPASPFLRDATLDSGSVAVRFQLTSDAADSVVRHIHLEGLRHFEYFQNLADIQASTGEAGELQVKVPAVVRKEDLAHFLQYLYSGHLDGEWRHVYAVWCLCDFLLAPEAWRNQLLDVLWQSVKGSEDLQGLQQLANACPEMRAFCNRLRKFMSVEQGRVYA